MRKLIPGLLAILAAAGFSLWAYPRLPELVPTHFGVDGEPNGWSSRLVAALIGPVGGLLLALVFSILPNIDPRRANYEKFSAIYWSVANVVIVFLALIHVLLLGKGIGWPVSIERVVPIAVGGLFAFVGSVLPRVRPNWFMGIRTPWTLSSDTVWQKTHRVGGVLFMLAGLCIMLTGLFASRFMLYAILIATGVAGLGSVVYSWYLWKEEQGSQPGSAARPS
jgi:uncharacterized membrane protein